MSNSSIWPIARILSSATTPSQSGAGNDGNEGVLRIPQSSSITEASSSDCLVSYRGDSLGGGALPPCRDVVAVFYGHIRLGCILDVFKKKYCIYQVRDEQWRKR